MQEICLPSEAYQRPTVTALGYFDGVHIAHAALLEHTVRLAKRLGAVPAVFTFRDAPHKDGVRLFSYEERLAAFAAHGIEAVFTADFEKVRHLCAERFVEDILIGMCGARAAVCGYNFRFGKGAAGDAAMLQALLPESYILPAVLLDGAAVSSSRVREALLAGDVEEAALLLGEPYTVSAAVLHGKGLGRRLGFPTANMKPDELLPQNGVYETRVAVGGRHYSALTDIGTRPTVEGEGERRMETYILHFKGDLYGQQLPVSFVRRLRGEKHFESAEELIAQLGADVKAIERTKNK
jgi:riboflavin kinase/FMN adenylyltransferase